MNAEWDIALKMFCNISKYQGVKVIGYSQVEKYDSDFFSQIKLEDTVDSNSEKNDCGYFWRRILTGFIQSFGRTESATEVLVTININNKLKQNLDFCHLPVYILDSRKGINNWYQYQFSVHNMKYHTKS